MARPPGRAWTGGKAEKVVEQRQMQPSLREEGVWDCTPALGRETDGHVTDVLERLQIKPEA